MQEEEGCAPPSPQLHPLSRDSSDAANHAVVKYYTFPEESMGDTSAYVPTLLRTSPRPGAPEPRGIESDESVESSGSESAPHYPEHELPPFSFVDRTDSPYPRPFLRLPGFIHVRRNHFSNLSRLPTERNKKHLSLSLPTSFHTTLTTVRTPHKSLPTTQEESEDNYADSESRHELPPLGSVARTDSHPYPFTHIRRNRISDPEPLSQARTSDKSLSI